MKPRRIRPVEEAPKAPTVVLAMMVKNERHVIRRALESALPVLSRFVLVDTGSSDDTLDIAREVLEGREGEIVARPWVSYGHNRTELAGLARELGDWLLFLDADEVVQWGGEVPDFTADGYEVVVSTGPILTTKVALVRTSLPWAYVGDLREVLVCEEPHRIDPSEWFRIVHYADGAESRRDPYERRIEEAELLRAALAERPEDGRLAFHLAEALHQAGDLQGAIAAYEHRVALGGRDEETYGALLAIAKLHDHRARLGAKPGIDQAARIAGLYLRAYAFRPSRPEAAVELARHFREHGRPEAATLFAERALSMPCVRERRHGDRHGVDQSVLDWRTHNESALTAYELGDYARAVSLWTEMLDRVPEELRAGAAENLRLAKERLEHGANRGSPLRRRDRTEAEGRGTLVP